jgi:hypothetical protein
MPDGTDSESNEEGQKTLIGALDLAPHDSQEYIVLEPLLNHHIPEAKQVLDVIVESIVPTTDVLHSIELRILLLIVAIKGQSTRNLGRVHEAESNIVNAALHFQHSKEEIELEQPTSLSEFLCQ